MKYGVYSMKYKSIIQIMIVNIKRGIPHTSYLIRHTRYVKWLLGVFFAVVIAGAALLLFNQSTTEAAWWDSTWQYRKAITVTNNTSAENNVYVTLSSYDTSDTSRYQLDCGDIRFTTEGGEMLKYYVVSGCGSSSTTIHIQFSTFPAGSQVIYLYYGNPSASNSFEASDFSTAATNASVGSPATEETTPGTIAYWSFDEGADNACPGGSNDICDSTNRHDAVRSGPTRQSEDACVSGQCLSFDGTDDNTVLPDNSAFDFAAADSFTVSGWFRTPPKSSGTYTLLSKQQTILGVGSTATTTITTSGDDGIGGNDTAWEDRVAYDPNNNRWHGI